jgi:hypothetical protein
MGLRIQKRAVLIAAALALVSGAACSATKAKFKAAPLSGQGSVSEEYVDQFPWSFCSLGDVAATLPVTAAADKKVSIKSSDCEYVSAPKVGLLPLNDFQGLIEHAAQDNPKFKQVAWRHGLTGWRVPKQQELFYAANQGYLRPGFWYAAIDPAGAIKKWRRAEGEPPADANVMPLYVRNGVGTANDGRLVSELDKEPVPTNPDKEDKDYGPFVGDLFEKTIMGSNYYIDVPEGHQLFTRIYNMQAVLEQIVTVFGNGGDILAKMGAYTLGQKTAWVQGSPSAGAATYRVLSESRNANTLKGATGARVKGVEYQNGVLITIIVDDSGFFPSHGVPDYDYNDIYVQVWLARSNSSVDWARRIDVR